MRAVRPDVKVLLTTGYAPESARIDSLLRARRLPLLEKPFSRASLAAKVRGAIDAAVPPPGERANLGAIGSADPSTAAARGQ